MDSKNNSQDISKYPDHMIRLNKDILIDSTARLPFLDKGSVRAFRAIQEGYETDSLYAMLCDPMLVPRHMTSVRYFKIKTPHMAQMMALGKVRWTDQKEYFVFVFKGPVLEPFFKPETKNFHLGLSSEIIVQQVVPALVSALNEIRNKEITHGMLWPGNIYTDQPQNPQTIILGECISAPASYSLPALFEPVERMMADPIGKGAGNIADDLYALGVTLAVMMRHSNPQEGKTDQEILEQKIEKGSYATLIGKERFRGGILELLRGLLYDDPDQRWTLDDIEAWRDGRRLTPKQSSQRPKGSRPLVFHGKKYTRPELLAHDLSLFPVEAVALFESGDLEQWVERAIEDKMIKARLEATKKKLSFLEKSGAYAEQLAALLASCLFPDSPLRYKGLKLYAGAFGRALAYHYMNEKDLQPFLDIMKNNALLARADGAHSYYPASFKARLDACRAILPQANLGNGLERCLYHLCPDLHCLSPVLKNYYVRSPEEMLVAFEDVCSTDRHAALFDRHTVAFLSLKDHKNIDPYLIELRSAFRHQRILGQIRTLSTIQKRAGLPALTHICDWVAAQIDEVLERFHDREVRVLYKKKIQDLKKEGNLIKIAALFDRPDLFQMDLMQFKTAMKEYQSLKQEKAKLQTMIKDKDSSSFHYGQQVGATIAILLSLFIILMTSYSKFLLG